MLFRYRLLNDWHPGCFFEGDGGGGTPSPPNPPGGGEPQVFTAEYVQALRGESANYRTRAREAETKLKELETSSSTTAAELQKAQELAANANARVVRAEVKAAAAKAGIVDPDTAYLLIKEQVKLGADGEPENVTALLEQLAKDKPFLVGQGGNGGGSTADPGRQRGGGLSKEAVAELARTNPAEFNRRWEAGEFKDIAF